MAYFLIAVSNRQNLDLCIRYSLAGFTSSFSGLWTYLDVNEGDFVSFLYGARVFNLYEVASKSAYMNADGLPPWPPVTFQPSGRTYHFPFRAQLRPIRSLSEQLVRTEFAYVAENLLLRGGYRKTHFEADQTTLQAVSEMGKLASSDLELLQVSDAQTFTPLFTNDKSKTGMPGTFLFRELFLQAMVRRHLALPDNLRSFLAGTGLASADIVDLEVLSEKAFPEGHVDLLIKEATPRGLSRKVVVEVKRRAAARKDIDQLAKYRQTLGEECVGAILLTGATSKRARQLASDAGVIALQYELEFPDSPAQFDDLVKLFRIV